MANQLEWEWDQRLFDKTLEEYMKVSSKTFQQILNTKAYYVARKALWFTRKADAGAIRSQLGTVRKVTRTVKTGRRGVRRRVTTYEFEDTHTPMNQRNLEAPLAVLLVVARGKRKGLRSPWHGKPRAAGAAAMTAAIRNLMVARVRAITFLRSGWLPAIDIFSPLADKGDKSPPKDAKRYGKAKGTGSPATPGFIARASIENYARTLKDPEFTALTRHGSPALQRAFDDEAASMWTYIKSKMDPDAAAFNAKQA